MASRAQQQVAHSRGKRGAAHKVAVRVNSNYDGRRNLPNVTKQLRALGLNSFMSYALGFVSIAASIAIWNAKKGEDNAHAERFGIFIGLWAPTFFAIGNGLELDERLTK